MMASHCLRTICVGLVARIANFPSPNRIRKGINEKYSVNFATTLPLTRIKFALIRQ